YENSRTQLDKVSLKNNLAFAYYGYGGALYLYGSDVDSFSHLTISGNHAKAINYAKAGAIFSEDRLGLHDSTLSNNSAFATGASGGAEGGTLYVDDYLTLDNVKITGSSTSTAATSGGYAEYGVFYCGDHCSFNNVTISKTHNT